MALVEPLFSPGHLVEHLVGMAREGPSEAETAAMEVEKAAGRPVDAVSLGGITGRPVSDAALIYPLGLVDPVVADATREGTPPDVGATALGLDKEMPVAAVVGAGLEEEAATSDSWDPSVVMPLLETRIGLAVFVVDKVEDARSGP